jgi:hypothetical protein
VKNYRHKWSIDPEKSQKKLPGLRWRERTFDRSAVKPPLKGQAGRPRFREAVMEE